MSEADIEMLRSGYEAFSRGDWEAALASAHPDLEMKTADRVTSPGTYRGVAVVTRFLQDFLEPFEEILIEPEEFFEKDDRIVALVRIRLRPRGSSAVVQNRIGHLWTVRDGKVVGLEIFPEREKALDAVGVSRFSR
jgi:uncharacterized protein